MCQVAHSNVCFSNFLGRSNIKSEQISLYDNESFLKFRNKHVPFFVIHLPRFIATPFSKRVRAKLPFLVANISESKLTLIFWEYLAYKYYTATYSGYMIASDSLCFRNYRVEFFSFRSWMALDFPMTKSFFLIWWTNTELNRVLNIKDKMGLLKYSIR